MASPHPTWSRWKEPDRNRDSPRKRGEHFSNHSWSPNLGAPVPQLHTNWRTSFPCSVSGSRQSEGDTQRDMSPMFLDPLLRVLMLMAVNSERSGTSCRWLSFLGDPFRRLPIKVLHLRPPVLSSSYPPSCPSVGSGKRHFNKTSRFRSRFSRGKVLPFRFFDLLARCRPISYPLLLPFLLFGVVPLISVGRRVYFAALPINPFSLPVVSFLFFSPRDRTSHDARHQPRNGDVLGDFAVEFHGDYGTVPPATTRPSLKGCESNRFKKKK